MTASLVTTATISKTIEELPENYVWRSHIGATIIGMLDNQNNKAVFVQGDEWVGKTSLLAEIANEYSHRCISLFIRPLSDLDISINYLRDELANQVHFLLYGQRTLKTIVDSDYSAMLTKLNSEVMSGYHKEAIIILVDGLAEYEENQLNLRDDLFKRLLPIGHPGFKFIFSGSSSVIPSKVSNQIKHDSFQVLRFSLSEAKQLFEGYHLTPQMVQAVFEKCDANPGAMASYCRELESGQAIEKLLVNPPTGWLGLIAREWNKKTLTETAELMAAFVAFGQRSYTEREISDLMEIPQPKVVNALGELGGVIRKSESGLLVFTTEAHRKYVRERLSKYRQVVFNQIILYLQTLGDAESSDELVTYYALGSLDEELTTLISVDFISENLEYQKSLWPAIQHTKNGIRSAEALKNNGEIFRMSLFSTVLNELDSIGINGNYIEALVKIGQIDTAIDAVDRVPLSEDRLVSLMVIARYLKGTDPTKFSSVLAQIESLVTQLITSDLFLNKDRYSNLVLNALYISPSIAFRLIQVARDDQLIRKSVQEAQDQDDGQIMGSKAIIGDHEDFVEKSEFIELLAVVSRFSKDKTQEELMRFIQNLPLDQQLFFILRWLEATNSEKADLSIVTKCLDLMVELTNVTPFINDFKLIAGALIKIAETSPKEVLDLIARIESISDAAQKRSTTAGIVRFHLELFLVELHLPAPRGQLHLNALHRIQKLVLEAMGNVDLPTKAHSLSLIYSVIVDEGNVTQNGLARLKAFQVETIPVLIDELTNCINEILGDTGSHLQLLRDVILVLSRKSIPLATDIVSRLNISERRDIAYFEIVESMLNHEFSTINLSQAFIVIDKITRQDLREISSVMLFRSLSTRDYELDSSMVEVLVTQLGRIRKFQNLEIAVLSYAHLANILAKLGSNKSEIAASKALEGIGHLSSDSEKLEIGYLVAKILSTRCKDWASNTLKLCDKLREETPEIKPTSDDVLIKIIRITIEAFRGEVKAKTVSSSSEHQIITVIEMLNSPLHQITMLAELAAAYFRDDDLDAAKRLIDKHLHPRILRIETKDNSAIEDCVVSALPIWFALDYVTAYDRLKSLSPIGVTRAVYDTCAFLFHGLLSHEPLMHNRPENVKIDYPRASLILKILDATNVDSHIAIICRWLTFAISSRNNAFIKEQRSELSQKIRKIALDKLPSPDGIQHDGYRIVLLGMCARLDESDGSVWQELKDKVADIPNASDRIFVYAQLAELMPQRLRKMGTSLITAAIDLMKTIPSLVERIDRYVLIADAAHGIDSNISRRALSEAVESLQNSSSNNMEGYVRSILDSAHRIDQTLSVRLGKLLEGDPVRARLNMEDINNHIDELKRSSTLSDKDANPDLKSMQIDSVLGLVKKHLAGLNAKRLNPVDQDRSIEFALRAAPYRLNKVVPVYQWIAQNERHRNRQDQSFLNTMINSCTEAVGIITRLTAGRATSDTATEFQAPTISSGRDIGLIDPGKRGNVMRRLVEFALEEIEDYVVIIDPYFGPQELQFVKLILDNKPDCRVSVMTSVNHHGKVIGVQEDALRLYQDFWRHSISDGALPGVDIYVVGLTSDGTSPIHDRWILTKSSGLKLGTSLNSIGHNSLSGITSVPKDEVNAVYARYVDIITRRSREVDGVPIGFRAFSLDS